MMPKPVLKQNEKRCIGQSNDNAQTAKRLKLTASHKGKECATPFKRHAKKTKSLKGQEGEEEKEKVEEVEEDEVCF